MLNGDLFVHRVRTLRDAWHDRRLVKRLAGSPEFDSQWQLLLLLYRWSEAAADDVRSVYGEGLDVSLSPVPEPTQEGLWFRLTVAERYAVEVALEERPPGKGHRQVAVSLSAPGRGSEQTTVTRRRQGYWTRAQFEELVLSLLGSYERAVPGETGGRGLHPPAGGAGDP